MDPAILGSLAQAGSNVVSNVVNTGSSILNNVLQRRNEKKVYERQRRDSLTDWNMQNTYNSPAEQMKRLKAANLNPNLVYKNGADNTGGPIRSSDYQSAKTDAPQVDLQGSGTAFNSYFDSKVKQAQVDNLQAAVKVAEQEALYKATQTVATAQSTKNAEFTLEQAKQLAPISLEQARVNVDKTKTDIYATLESNERAAAQNSQSLKEGAERILSLRQARAKTEDERQEIRQRINNLKQDSELKKIEIYLRDKGINPNDPTWLRVLSRIADGVSPSKVMDELNRNLNSVLQNNGEGSRKTTSGWMDRYKDTYPKIPRY